MGDVIVVWEILGHLKDLVVLVLALVCIYKLIKTRLASIKFGLDGITATVKHIVDSELEKAQALALAHGAKLRRDLVEIGNLAIGDRGFRSMVLLETIERGVKNIEDRLASSSGVERLAYGAALLDAYELLLHQAREHWGSSGPYQARWSRVLAGLSQTIVMCNSISGVEVDPSGTAANDVKAHMASAGAG